MPITASMGGLAYIKTNLGSNWNYYYVELFPTGAANYSYLLFNTSTFDSEGKYYFGGLQGQSAGTYDPGFFISKIDDYRNQAPSLNFTNTYRVGTNNGQCFDLKYDSAGNTINGVGDLNNDGAIIKIDPSGNIDTQIAFEAYDGPNSTQGLRQIQSIQTFASGNYVVTGITNERFSNLPNSNNYTTFITMFSSSDVKIFDKKIQTGNSNVQSTSGNQIISSDDTGNLYLSGETTLSPTYFFLAKLPNNGANILWQKKFQMGNTLVGDGPRAFDAGGNSYIAYQTTLTGTPGGILKIDSSGNIVWDKVYGNSTSGINNIYDIKLNEGNSSQLLVLSSPSSSPITDHLITSIHTSNGNVGWVNRANFVGSNSYANIGMYLGQISANGANIYINGVLNSTTIVGQGGVILKVPSDGTTPGSGTYNLNGNLTLTYVSTTLNPTVGNIVASNANLVLSNALTSNTPNLGSSIDPNLHATFSSSRL